MAGKLGYPGKQWGTRCYTGLVVLMPSTHLEVSRRELSNTTPSKTRSAWALQLKPIEAGFIVRPNDRASMLFFDRHESNKVFNYVEAR